MASGDFRAKGTFLVSAGSDAGASVSKSVTVNLSTSQTTMAAGDTVLLQPRTALGALKSTDRTNETYHFYVSSKTAGAFTASVDPDGMQGNDILFDYIIFE